VAADDRFLTGSPTSEYATGSIRSTLQWTPVRRDVVLAKAIVLAPVLFGYGLLLGGIAALAGGITAGSRPFCPVVPVRAS
jgi:hypothetical protein